MADDGGTSTGGIVAGFFSFTEVTDSSAHRAYNEWHQLDHLPEQLPLEGVSHGQRWVASPACRALARTSDGADELGLSLAHYVTLYLLRSPLEESLKDFYGLARRLRAEGRFFSERRAVSSGPLYVRQRWAADRVRVSAAALPYRPNRGVYVVVKEPSSGVPSSRGGGPSLGAAPSVPAGVMEAEGVAGFWTFAPGGDLPQTAPESQERIRSDVIVCFLDGDPMAVSADLGPLFYDEALQYASPYLTVQPWSWDWFEEGRQ